MGYNDGRRNIQSSEKKFLTDLKLYHVLMTFVFVVLSGSRTFGDENKDSDTDICFYYDVENRDGLSKLYETISSSFPDNYDINLFQLLPLQVKRNVLQGKILYMRDGDEVFDIAYFTIEDYRFYRPLHHEVIS